MGKERGDLTVMEYKEIEMPLKQKGDQEIGVSLIERPKSDFNL